MNPNQGNAENGENPPVSPQPAPQYPARPNVELTVPQRPVNVPLRDAQNANGAALQPAPQPQLAAPQAMQPQQPAPYQPPAPTPPVTPAAPQPAYSPVQPPVQTTQPIQPAPTQQLPPQPQEAFITPMPADVLPPQQVPAVPTFSPATPPTNPTTTLPTTQPNPATPTQPAVNAAPTSSAPTASFTPTPTAHVSDDIVARISETPMRASSDIPRKNNGIGGKFKGFLSFLIFIVSVAIAAFLINQFIFQSYYVEGTSMTPTLQNNDRLIISKVERTFALATGQPYIPERGQIVVLDSSLVGSNGQHEQLIKRVVGLPGERIHIENGTAIIFNSANPDGIDITQELGLTYLQAVFTDGPIDTVIPAGQVYVMGDNRGENGSYDSRAFGPVEGNKIQGRLWARVLPLDKAQLY